MRRLFSFLFGAILLFAPAHLALADAGGAQQGIAAAPTNTAPEGSCTCFCGQEGVGAAQVGQPMTPGECQNTCTKSNQVLISCATDVAHYPSKIARCFDEPICTLQGGTFDVNYQPAECPKGMHYCYPPSNIDIPLNVAIGDIGKVQNFGEYVNVFYKYLLGIAVTIAIVFVMIGGLRYTLAGASGETTKAKAMIKNAITGLALLTFAYLILYTVNPNLTKLIMPSFPMIKRIEFVSGAQSCEYLKGTIGGKDYTIANGAPKDSPNVGKPYIIDDNHKDAKPGAYGRQKCGSTSIVSKDGEGNDVSDGVTCQYEYCDGADERCVGQGETAKCVKCLDAYHLSPMMLESQEAPSEYTCNRLALPNRVGVNPADGQYNYCFYSQNPMLALSPVKVGLILSPLTLIGVTSGFLVEAKFGSCAQMQIDCTKINSCADYATNVSAESGVSGKSTLGYVEPWAGYSTGKTIADVCQEDICQEGKKAGGRCVHVDNTWPRADGCNLETP